MKKMITVLLSLFRPPGYFDISRHKMKRFTRFFLMVIICMSLFSCSSKKTVTAGSFTFDCPKDMEWIITEDVEVPDVYRDVQYLMYSNEKEEYGERSFIRSPDDPHFILDMEMIWVKPEEAPYTLSELNDMKRAGLQKNGGTWTVFTQIEKKEDSIILRAAPYQKTEIQDYGVWYYRWFDKEDGTGYVELYVREDADAKYQDIIVSILKSIR